MKLDSKLLLSFSLTAGHLIQSSLGFSMSIMGKADAWRGSFSVIQWHDGARNVNVMLAVQNKDGTLSPVGQTTFNVAPYGTTIIDINRDTPVGRNYFYIAEDMIDPSNYTSVGPFAIYEANGDTHPTNSVVASATERFLTDVRPTATSSQSSTVTGIRSQSTYTPTGDSSKNDSNNMNDRAQNTVISVVQIVGIAIGCVGAVILGAIVYACCFRQRPKSPLKVTYPNGPYGPNQQMGAPAPIITPVAKKQSIKKPVVSKIDSDSTVVSSIASPKTQENTTITMNNDLSYTHEMTHQPPLPTAMTHQQAYPYYGNEMYYGNQQMAYPSQDTMSIPTHFSHPASPASTSFAYMQQQQMYPPQMQTANHWNYTAFPPPTSFDYSPKPDTNDMDSKTEQVLMTAATATKTELAAATKTEQAEPTLAQKFETSSEHADVHQVELPDTASLFQKPNDNTTPIVQKPNTRSSFQ
ncbi:aspartate-semialdehyde dehydrogenase [Mucor velutinosus]|uniref:Aspartate-semialdehyde dehydrogenase n=1 Tax=Mucor velutinosus TaxID=708070 RepID=A0AAN7DBV0_9FUNG|nr:aspartate-semialdehyde dehydrogenase [Mucor velutinosus]